MPTEAVRLLRELTLYGSDSPDYKQARELLSRTGYSDPRVARELLVRLGVWDPDEDLEILRLGVRTEFNESLLASCGSMTCEIAPSASREDLRNLEAFTIDGPSTRDFDDALSLEVRDGVMEVGVHIADVAGLVPPGSPVDREAQQRGASLYLPRRQIPMIPPELSQDILSLRRGCDRPAISLICRMSPNGEVLEHRFTRSLIRVKRQLTYEEVNHRYKEEPVLLEMHRLATAFQQKRIEGGALVLSAPEMSIRVDDDRRVFLHAFDQDTPARMLVAEFMILYNWLSARFCRDRGVPILYRGQDEPSERLNIVEMDPLFYVFMQRRKLQPMVIDMDPSPHSGLGLEAYNECHVSDSTLPGSGGPEADSKGPSRGTARLRGGRPGKGENVRGGEPEGPQFGPKKTDPVLASKIPSPEPGPAPGGHGPLVHAKQAPPSAHRTTDVCGVETEERSRTGAGLSHSRGRGEERPLGGYFESEPGDRGGEGFQCLK